MVLLEESEPKIPNSPDYYKHIEQYIAVEDHFRHDKCDMLIVLFVV